MGSRSVWERRGAAENGRAKCDRVKMAKDQVTVGTAGDKSANEAIPFYYTL